MSLEKAMAGTKGGYGRPHYRELFEVLPSGERVLYAQHKEKALWAYYRENNSFYHGYIAFKLEETLKGYDVLESFNKTHNGLYRFMIYGGFYLSDINRVFNTLDNSFRSIIEQYKEDPKRVEQELNTLFEMIQKHVLEKPQDFMGVMGCLK